VLEVSLPLVPVVELREGWGGGGDAHERLEEKAAARFSSLR
jgi:hypothetical protein